MNNRIPLTKALAWILLSLVVISGSAALVLYVRNRIKSNHEQDLRYQIIAIAQKSTNAEALKTAYLAELLELSVDRPQNLYRFDLEEAKRKLRASSLIQDVEVNKIKPGTLFIEYSLRKPIAFLGDYSNTAIDAKGTLIPFKPFFTPKKLPEIFLGLPLEQSAEEPFWGKTLEGAKASLALEIYSLATRFCCSESAQLKCIDVTRAHALSYGQRQIIVIIEDRFEKDECFYTQPRILRLSTENFRQELAHYNTLHSYLLTRECRRDGGPGHSQEPTIIDLRVPRLAFIK